MHAQLNTQTKLFSPALNRFGQEPNVDIHPVCSGQPGALPKLNREAVHKALRLGLALGSQINLQSRFDRKSYVYPDSPRNYQITQYFTPLILGGQIDCELDGSVRTFVIDRAHLEDDAGMLKHFSNFAGVDYNRAGIPLIEIVSRPDFRTSTEASAFVSALKLLMEYANISDCNMERGNLRVDANVSVRPAGTTALRNKVEIKNLNSLAAMRAALDSEIARQIRSYETHEPVREATFRWDPDAQKTTLMRLKERAQDYRYFPDPDLPPLIVSQKLIDEVKESLPELPQQKKRRYMNELGLTRYSAETLLADRSIASYFEEALATAPGIDPRALCNWITVEIAGRLSQEGLSIAQSGISPIAIAELVTLVTKGEITGKIAKSIADQFMVQRDLSPADYLRSNPHLRPVDNRSNLEPIVDAVLAENVQSIGDYYKGKQRAFGHLIGQVMAKSRGAAAPGVVHQLLKEKLENTAPPSQDISD